MTKLLLIACFVMSGAVAAMAAPTDARSVLNTYVMTAAVAERCGQSTLTMIEELRLAQLIKRESAEDVSSASVWAAMALARSGRQTECGDPMAREQTRQFIETIRPQLQSPYMAPWTTGAPSQGGQPASE